MYYLFIVNNFELSDQVIEGKEIVDKLLEQRIWLFHQGTPNIKKIQPKDKVIIYIAGKGNRYFYANFEIAGEITSHNLQPTDNIDKNLYEFFPLSCPINILCTWTNPIDIYDIKEDLDFITDKKNYGLFFRQSTKVISEEDYEKIIKRGNKQNYIQ